MTAIGLDVHWETTMSDTKMLIGDDFVAGTETPERVLNPKTEDVLVDLADDRVARRA